MSFKPILFSTLMVQAILDGRKTQTRRTIKPQPTILNDNNHFNFKDEYYLTREQLITKGDIQKGDVLWVREMFCTPENWDHWPPSSLPDGVTINYKADLDNDDIDKLLHRGKWRPSIHMPKKFCRIFLEVTDVRVERLQDISSKDAEAEGIEPINIFNSVYSSKSRLFYKNYLADNSAVNRAQYSFQTLWESINGNESWNENPWVWVYEFKSIEKPENFI